MATTRKKTARQRRASNEMPWDKAALAPVVMIRADEGVLADRAIAQLRYQARQQASDVEMHNIDSSEYESGRLAILTSPSLFGEPRFIVLTGMETAREELANDIIAYLQNPDPDSWVVLRFEAGSRRVKMMDAIDKAKVPVYFAPELKYASDRLNYVRSVVREARRQIDPDAATALVDALPDVAELTAMTNQLLADVDGPITALQVHKYQAGRIEADVFAIIDQAVAGNTARALTLLRHGLATGLKPMQLHGAIAARVRLIAKLSSEDAPGYAQMKIHPKMWQGARQQARRYRPEQLTRMVEAVAACQADLKGQSKDPEYALEKMIMTLRP